MRRSACGGCGATGLHSFLDLGSSPLADAFPRSPDEPETFYPLELAVCTRCWLVQLMEVVPDDVLFGGDYGFFTGSSPSSVAYFKEYAEQVLSAFPERARRLTVEIACNDGTLLKHFADAGCRTVGVDPAKPAAAEAERKGLNVVSAPFTRRLAAELGEEYGPAGVIVANNVAAHVADLDDFFGGIADLLARDGVAIVEVQNVADLLTGNQFDHVYHEHRYYFSVESLAAVAWRHGLEVRAVRHTPAQGGSIRVALTRGSHAYVEDPWLRDLSTYDGMQGCVEHIRSRLLGLLHNEEREGRKLSGYAASAKSTTLLNFCGIGPDHLEYVVDTTPHKIGRVTPGTHIPIISPEQEADRGRADTYLLLAWNYLPGILRREREFTVGGGRFVVPIPVPVIL